MALGAHLICPTHLLEKSPFPALLLSLAALLECFHVLHCQPLGQRVIKYTGTRKLFKMNFFKKLHTSETNNNLNTMQFQYVQKLGHRDPV